MALTPNTLVPNAVNLQTKRGSMMAGNHNYPPVPKSVVATDVLARSVKIEWTPQEIPAIVSELRGSRKVIFQLSKSEANSGVFKSCHEGEKVSCVVTNLIPSTKYTFKVRTMYSDSPVEDDWSVDYISVEVETTGN